eukprot:2534343-Rhodomonas_salina.6
MRTLPVFLLLCSLHPCSSFVKFTTTGWAGTGTGQVSGRPPLRVPENAGSFSDLRRKLGCRQNQNRHGLRMSKDSEGGSDVPSMKQLQMRVSELKDRIEAENEELKFNWRAGLMSHEPVVSFPPTVSCPAREV